MRLKLILDSTKIYKRKDILGNKFHGHNFWHKKHIDKSIFNKNAPKFNLKY